MLYKGHTPGRSRKRPFSLEIGRRRLGGVRIGFVVVALLLVGCADATGEPGGTVQSGTSDPNGLVPVSGLHRELIAEVISRTAELPVSDESVALHREVFGDGEVTFSDYERAIGAAAQCLRDFGYEVEGPFRYGEGGSIHIEPGVDPNQIISFHAVDPPDSFSADSETCQGLWQWRIEDAWFTLIAPTEQEIQVWLEAAWDCAREMGISISDPPDFAIDSGLIPFGPDGCEPWTALPTR